MRACARAEPAFRQFLETFVGRASELVEAQKSALAEVTDAFKKVRAGVATHRCLVRSVCAWPQVSAYFGENRAANSQEFFASVSAFLDSFSRAITAHQQREARMRDRAKRMKTGSGRHESGDACACERWCLRPPLPPRAEQRRALRVRKPRRTRRPPTSSAPSSPPSSRSARVRHRRHLATKVTRDA